MILSEVDADVFRKGKRVRFKKDIQVARSDHGGICYEQISAGTEGLIHTVIPFVIHINSSASTIKEFLWDPLDGVDEGLEIIREYPVLRIVK